MGRCGNSSGRGMTFFGKMLCRTSEPRAPGPMFFFCCVSVGAVFVADPPSLVPPTRVPAGARTLEFSKFLGAGSKFPSGSENAWVWSKMTYVYVHYISKISVRSRNIFIRNLNSERLFSKMTYVYVYYISKIAVRSRNIFIRFFFQI